MRACDLERVYTCVHVFKMLCCEREWGQDSVPSEWRVEGEIIFFLM